MLLVITSEQDGTWKEVADFVKTPIVKIEYNSEKLPNAEFTAGSEGFEYFYRGIDLKQITSVWYRLGWRTYPRQKMKDQWWLFNRLNREGFIEYLYGVLNVPWISNPYAIQRAENKMLQLQIAKECGVAIPETLVTTNEGEAWAFLRQHERIIVKPVAKEIVWEDDETPLMFFTSRIRFGDEVHFKGLDRCPVILQNELQRQCDLRVAVVDNQVFAASIIPKGPARGIVDWRTCGVDSLDIGSHDLPKKVQDQCIAIIKNLGIRFGALDLILGTDGQYYFLENNATGAWATYARRANLPVAQALAKALDNPV